MEERDDAALTVLSITKCIFFIIILIYGALGQTRTGTPKWARILSPLCLPISPRGHISVNIIYNKYPIFNWNKGYCLNCETYIRVAEFKPQIHQSIEEAINDERTLPFDQSQNWLKLENVSSYQYPISGARSLEYGKIYF